MDKSLLRPALVAALRAELERLTNAALLARDEATNEESKAENKYDTRGQEAAYLAEGQARIATELHETISIYESLPFPAFEKTQPLSIGAVVTLEAKGRLTHYLLGPRNGGLELTCDGRTLVVVTPQSPLGRQLFGKRVGDKATLPGRAGAIIHRIAEVA